MRIKLSYFVKCPVRGGDLPGSDMVKLIECECCRYHLPGEHHYINCSFDPKLDFMTIRPHKVVPNE